MAAIDLVLRTGFSGTLNVVDGQPLTLRELMDQVCTSQGLEPVQWLGGSGAAPTANRRIRNDRLLALGQQAPPNLATPSAMS